VSALRYFLLGAEKAFPYRWQAFEMPAAFINNGQAWCEEQLSRLGEHYATGEWPLVVDQLVEVSIPTWLGLDESEAA
jgi:hypothetical protein